MDSNHGWVRSRLLSAGAAVARNALVPVCAAWLALPGLTLLAGCGSEPKAVPPQPARMQPTVDELLQQADAAAKAGDRIGAQQLYRNAARAYPASKQPWLKMAEEAFVARDYGNAILAADEVLQRDPNDRVALSITTVGGLRVSTTAVAKLRSLQAALPANRQDEVLKLAGELREALNQPLLVPTPQPPLAPSAAPPVRPAPSPTTSPPGTTGRPPQPSAAPRPSPSPAPKPANPLDKLN